MEPLSLKEALAVLRTDLITLLSSEEREEATITRRIMP